MSAGSVRNTIRECSLVLCADVSDGASSGSEDEAGAQEGHKGRSAERTVGPTLDTHDNPLAALQLKLKELTTAYELVLKNSHQLTKFASELESSASKPNSGKPVEKLAMLKITSAAIVKVCLVSLLSKE